MSTLHFRNVKRSDVKGQTPTHWTNDNMQHCTCISGEFPNNPTDAAKEIFKDTYHDSDGDKFTYHDGEQLLTGKPCVVPVYGLIKIGNEFYWTGHTVQVKFTLTITTE